MSDVLLQEVTTSLTQDGTDADVATVELTRDDLMRLLKALAEPTRLRIVDLLMEGVQCNCEIAQRLDLSYSLISHHMRVLRLAGLVESEQSPDDERWVYYSLDRTAVERLLAEMKRLLDPARIQARAPACGPQSGKCGS
jgi:ArsR family transcriptional regulator, arsenate/arsenite/antimonite-responsive transcriptional repressor